MILKKSCIFVIVNKIPQDSIIINIHIFLLTYFMCFSSFNYMYMLSNCYINLQYEDHTEHIILIIVLFWSFNLIKVKIKGKTNVHPFICTSFVSE